MNRFFAFLYLAVFVTACAECEVIPGMKTAFYGITQDGDTVTQYTLTNASGAQFKVIDYGCRVTNIMVPDREGKMADVVLGYENLKDYETGAERFFGALLGRYANRIAGGNFMIDSVRYQLSCNESPNGHPGHLALFLLVAVLTERRDILVIWTVKSLITGLRTILGV